MEAPGVGVDEWMMGATGGEEDEWRRTEDGVLVSGERVNQSRGERDPNQSGNGLLCSSSAQMG